MGNLVRRIADRLVKKAACPEDPEPEEHEPHGPVMPIEEPFGIPESGQQEQLRWSDYSHKARKPITVMNDYRRL